MKLCFKSHLQMIAMATPMTTPTSIDELAVKLHVFFQSKDDTLKNGTDVELVAFEKKAEELLADVDVHLAAVRHIIAEMRKK